MKIQRFKLVFVIGLFGLLICSCAGGRGGISFKTASYPISMSQMLFDSQGRNLPPQAFQIVGTVSAQRRLWGIMYSWIPLGGTRDVSEDMNRQISAVSGEGVVGLHAVVKGCGLNGIFPLTLLPIWPGCAKVEVKGWIVRRMVAVGLNERKYSDAFFGSTQDLLALGSPERLPDKTVVPAVDANNQIILYQPAQ